MSVCQGCIGRSPSCMLAGKECEPDLGPLHSVIVGSLSFPFFFVVFAIYRVKAGALLATTSKVPIRAANFFIEFAFGASIHIISLFYSAPRLCPYFITVFFPFFSRWLCPIPEPNNVWCNKTIVSHAVDDGINSRSSNIVPFFSAFDKTNQRDRPHHFFATNSSVSNRKKVGKPWPTPRPPMAPIGGFVAVVDGVVLPDTPLRMIKQGKINTNPNGEKVQVIIGRYAVCMPVRARV